VTRGSPAARIGLQPRDIIIELNGTSVASTEILEGLVAEDPSVWRVEIERGGQRIRQYFR
jgi:S1-C subfamily serine protease